MGPWDTQRGTSFGSGVPLGYQFGTPDTQMGSRDISLGTSSAVTIQNTGDNYITVQVVLCWRDHWWLLTECGSYCISILKPFRVVIVDAGKNPVWIVGVWESNSQHFHWLGVNCDYDHNLDRPKDPSVSMRTSDKILICISVNSRSDIHRDERVGSGTN